MMFVLLLVGVAGGRTARQSSMSDEIQALCARVHGIQSYECDDENSEPDDADDDVACASSVDSMSSG